MYLSHNHWMICDRCGGQYRYSDMKEEWTGLWVCTGCFQTRHPQDFVTGVTDDQTVPVARPDIPQTMGETTLASSYVDGDTIIHLTSSEGLSEGDPIGIVMDNGAATWSYIKELPPVSGAVVFQGQSITFGGDPDVTFGGQTEAYVTLGSPLLGNAASGNEVLLPSINSENWT
jgi:hypothetical protein